MFRIWDPEKIILDQDTRGKKAPGSGSATQCTVYMNTATLLRLLQTFCGHRYGTVHCGSYYLQPEAGHHNHDADDATEQAYVKEEYAQLLQ
jgi:hypothetical protein